MGNGDENAEGTADCDDSEAANTEEVQIKKSQLKGTGNVITRRLLIPGKLQTEKLQVKGAGNWRSSVGK